MLWFGLKDRVSDLEATIDENTKKLDQLLGIMTGNDEDSVKILPKGSNYSYDDLPDDPHTLKRMLVSRRLKRQLEKEDMKELFPKRPRQEPNGEMTVEATPQNIATEARAYYESANPIVKMLIASEVKKRTGYDIQQILSDENLLGQVISGLLGVAVGKVAEMVQKPAESTALANTSGQPIAGPGGPLFVPSYDPKKPPTAQ